MWPDSFQESSGWESLLFTHILRKYGLNLSFLHDLSMMKLITFLWQILTKDSSITISQGLLDELNKAFKYLYDLSLTYFQYDFFQFFHSSHALLFICPFLKHTLCFDTCKFQLMLSLSCGTHCLFLSSSPEPKHSLHLSCSVKCPQVTSVYWKFSEMF